MSTEADKRKRVYYHTPQRRPYYHYTPKKNWMSDPNGLIRHEGEYHYFYQHDAYNHVFSNMSWGHAVSKDLIHWEELPTAISPTEDGLGMIFSGGTIVDEEGRAGLGKDTMLALYTSPTPRQQQSMAYSKDHGRTWTKYEDNPVIANRPDSGIGKDFRDPKIMRLEEAGLWIMSISARDHIEFWSSGNLVHWEKESDFGYDHGAHEHRGNGSWECPDLIPISLEGNPDRKVWALIVSMNQGGPNGECGTQYFIGDFREKGGKWTFDSYHRQVKWLDFGPDNYAGVTFTNMMERPVMMAWLSNWQYAQDIPTGPWRGVASVPRVLKVKESDGSYIMTNEPIDAVRELSEELLMEIGSFSFGAGMAFEDLSASRLVMSVTDIAEEGLEVIYQNTLGEVLRIGYSQEQQALYLDRRMSGEVDFRDNFADRIYLAPTEKLLKDIELEVLMDNMTIEVFANGGSPTMSGLIFPTEPYNHLEIRTKGKVTDCRLYRVKRVIEQNNFLDKENTYSQINSKLLTLS